jgi:hypothetical protein
MINSRLYPAENQSGTTVRGEPSGATLTGGGDILVGGSGYGGGGWQQ